MTIARKLITGGLASLTAVTGAVAVLNAPTAGAMPVADMKVPQKVLKLKTVGNAAVDVATELDCSTHTITAKVTNNTSTTIHPNISFNGELQEMPEPIPIEPGKTQSYFYSYTGNNTPIQIEVSGDTFSTVTADPDANCLEPVSFRATDWSNSAVVGSLSNNSTLVPQTVYVQVGDGDVRLETLQPGETRTIAMPFNGYPEQTSAYVTVATAAGYESSYMIDLEKPVVPPIPLPTPVE
jgi:hypothetical protein